MTGSGEFRLRSYQEGKYNPNDQIIFSDLPHNTEVNDTSSDMQETIEEIKEAEAINKLNDLKSKLAEKTGPTPSNITNQPQSVQAFDTNSRDIDRR